MTETREKQVQGPAYTSLAPWLTQEGSSCDGDFVNGSSGSASASASINPSATSSTLRSRLSKDDFPVLRGDLVGDNDIEDVNGDDLCKRSTYVLPDCLTEAISDLERQGRRLSAQSPIEGAMLEPSIARIRQAFDELTSQDAFSVAEQKEQEWLAELKEAVGRVEGFLMPPPKRKLRTEERNSTGSLSSLSSASMTKRSRSYGTDVSSLGRAARSVSENGLGEGGPRESHGWQVKRDNATKKIILACLTRLQSLSREKGDEEDCEWLCKIDDKFVADVEDSMENTAWNIAIRRCMVRWLKHLAYAIEVLGTGDEDRDLEERCASVTALRGRLEDYCSCQWTTDADFAECTWRHIQRCLLPAIERNKDGLKKTALEERKRRNAARSNK